MAASEIFQLIDSDIPGGRQHLQDNHANLELLAQHCEDRYKQADDKFEALQETKGYTTHSLASVAYQIHTLASNFLHLLDLQQEELSGMESSINHLSQIVSIHKEKVARREIGVLTANRPPGRTAGTKNGIMFPEQTERPVKYQRKPIDYTQLDGVGHGIRGPSAAPKSSRPSSVTSQTSVSSHAPTMQPPTPPVDRSSVGSHYGTLGRSHRTVPPPVAPPSVPTPQPGVYAPGQSQNATRDRYEMLYAPSVMGMIRSPPPIGAERPPSERMGRISYRDSSVDSQLPPPPPDDMDGAVPQNLASTAAPPPPPPPPEAMAGMEDDIPPPPPPEFSDDTEDDAPPPPPEDPYMETGPQFTAVPDWVPEFFIEKVVAIFDYTAEKDDELTFCENALIYVIKKNEDDWWEGVMDGRRGLFPSNYVDSLI